MKRPSVSAPASERIAWELGRTRAAIAKQTEKGKVWAQLTALELAQSAELEAYRRKEGVA